MRSWIVVSISLCDHLDYYHQRVILSFFRQVKGFSKDFVQGGRHCHYFYLVSTIELHPFPRPSTFVFISKAYIFARQRSSFCIHHVHLFSSSNFHLKSSTSPKNSFLFTDNVLLVLVVSVYCQITPPFQGLGTWPPAPIPSQGSLEKKCSKLC